MNTCSLCITENHPDAVVCKACGATKVVQAKAGYLRGLAILGLSCFGILVLLPGRYLLGFGALAAAVAVAKTSLSQVVWMRKV